MILKETLKKICEMKMLDLNIIKIKNELKKLIPKDIDIINDQLNNIIFKNKNFDETKRKIMITANFEEESLMATKIESNGNVCFLPIGDISAEDVVCKSVILKEKLNGIIGTKPIHLQTKEEKQAKLKIKNLFIDFGFKDKKEAEKFISIGETLNFFTSFSEIDENTIKSKSLGDRFCCYVLINLLADSLNIASVFLTKEKAISTSSKPAAFLVNPDIAIVLKPYYINQEKENFEENVMLLPIKNNHMYYDEELINLAEKTAKENKITLKKIILKNKIETFKQIATSRTGIKTIAFLIPCKNFWPYNILKKQDMLIFMKFIKSYLKKLSN